MSSATTTKSNSTIPLTLTLLTVVESGLGLTQSVASQAGQLVFLLNLLRRLHVPNLTIQDNSDGVFSQFIHTHDTPLPTKTHSSSRTSASSSASAAA